MKQTEKRILPFRAVIGLMLIAIVLGAIAGGRNPIVWILRILFSI
jgi:hypothetical protein